MNGESNLEEMTKLALSQESEIQSLFAEHKLRVRKPQNRALPKL